MSHLLAALEDVSVELGGVPILRGVTAPIERGRITALIGLNGSGKTTLLRALLGEVPHRGKIEFRCQHQAGPTPQHIGYVPQKLRVEANLPLTVRDLLALALQRWPLFLGVSRRTEATIRQLLER